MKWFNRRGYLFFPASIPGWVIFVGVAAYLVYAFIDIDRRSHSVSDTLINWTFNLLIAGLIYTAIAFITSRKKD